MGCKQQQLSDTLSPSLKLQTVTHNTSDPSFAQPTSQFTLAGNTSGYGSLRTDGIADFGLVLKSFTKSDLFQIELNDLMSTEFDKISIIGSSIDIPSNVALPQQRERYILSINLNKPTYKIQFDEDDDQQLVLLHGQFPFSDVVQGFRNDQPLLKLADKFNILSFSEYQFSNDTFKNLNLDLVAGQKTHSTQFQARAPQSFNSEYSFVVVALDQKQDVFLANNLTVLGRNEVRNLKITAPDTYIFSGLIHDSLADSESKSLLKYKMTFQMQTSNLWTSELLDFIEGLRFQNDEVTFTKPDNKGFNELGLAYNIIETSPAGVETIVDQNAILGAWSSNIDLFFMRQLRKPNHTYRIDLFMAAAGHAQLARDYNELFELAEFISRNSLQL